MDEETGALDEVAATDDGADAGLELADASLKPAGRGSSRQYVCPRHCSLDPSDDAQSARCCPRAVPGSRWSISRASTSAHRRRRQSRGGRTGARSRGRPRRSPAASRQRSRTCLAPAWTSRAPQRADSERAPLLNRVGRSTSISPASTQQARHAVLQRPSHVPSRCDDRVPFTSPIDARQRRSEAFAGTALLPGMVQSVRSTKRSPWTRCA